MPRRLRSAAGGTTLSVQVRRGAAWSAVNSIVMRIGSFLVGIVAARLLAPEEFGVFAVALTVHAVILNISDLGVSAFVVRHQGDLDRVGPTMVTVALAVSGVLAGVMVLTAGPLAASLGAPQAETPVRVLAITVLLAGVSSVPTALLVRGFHQDRRFLAEAVSFVVGNGILIPLALAGAGALALAWSRVGGFAASTLMLLVLSPERYRPGFDTQQLRRLLPFGIPLAGTTLLGFAIANVDYVVIGRALGAFELGLYFLAYNVAGWPHGVLSPVLASVALPAFSRLREDRQRLPEYVAAALSVLVTVSVLVGVLLAVVARPLISVVYGEEWLGAAGALSVIALYGALRVPVDLMSNAMIALGRTRALLWGQIAYAVVLAPCMVYGVSRGGIVGAAAAHVVGIVLVLVPSFVFLLREHAGLRVARFLQAVTPPVLAGAAAGAGAVVAMRQVDIPVLDVLVGCTAGTLLYLLCLGRWLVSAHQNFQELRAAPAVDIPSMRSAAPAEAREGTTAYDRHRDSVVRPVDNDE